jgi:repressor LexA
MTVGQRIIQILKDRGIQQIELARYLGASQSTVNGWNLKNRNPTSEYIMPICEFLKITPTYLLTGVEDDESDYTSSNDERKLLKYYRQLPVELKNKLLGYAGGMCDTYLDSLDERKSYESRIS